MSFAFSHTSLPLPAVLFFHAVSESFASQGVPLQLLPRLTSSDWPGVLLIALLFFSVRTTSEVALWIASVMQMEMTCLWPQCDNLFSVLDGSFFFFFPLFSHSWTHTTQVFEPPFPRESSFPLATHFFLFLFSPFLCFSLTNHFLSICIFFFPVWNPCCHIWC